MRTWRGTSGSTWVVERFFAWLHNSRRLVTRWERHAENILGMLQLGCMRILLKRL
jgi:transposase